MLIAKYLIGFIGLIFSASQPTLAEEKPDFTVFPISTEVQIGKLQKFLIDAPTGIYLTVGAERGFRAASMMRNLTELWLIDVAEDIIKFNQINTQLLKNPNRLAYLKLRWEADFNTWKSQKLNLTQTDFNWWASHIRNLDQIDYALPEYLNKFGKAPQCTKKNNQDVKLTKLDKIDLGTIIDYKHGNYLFSDTLYARLNKLALNNKIYIAKLDLSNKNNLAQLSEKLRNQNISVLDLNNLYHSSYIGEGKYIELVQQLLPYGKNDSILIAMSNYKKVACAQFQIYLGFTFGQVKKWPVDFKMQFFIDSIPEKIDDLIDGRLYTEEDKLPVFRK